MQVWFKISLSVVSLLLLIPLSFAAEKEEKNQTFVPPDYSGEAPVGRKRGAGTRGGCEEIAKLHLIPLIPEDSRGLTVSESPRLWFYYKTGSEAIAENSPVTGQMILKDVTTQETTQLDITLPARSRLFSLPLPSSLQTGHWYNWYLSIDCANSDKKMIAISDGLIKRVEEDNSTSERDYAQQGIWYDAVAVLAEAKCEKPMAWNGLLSDVALREVAQETENFCTTSTKINHESLGSAEKLHDLGLGKGTNNDPT